MHLPFKCQFSGSIHISSFSHLIMLGICIVNEINVGIKVMFNMKSPCVFCSRFNHTFWRLAYQLVRAREITHTLVTSIFTGDMPMDSLSHFDEKSGVVSFDTDWGRWWQNVHEVHIEVNVPNNTRAKDVSVKVCPGEISCTVCNKVVFKV